MARLGGGVRSKSRNHHEVCADCGAFDPAWASINRGILICDECCSVHRSLGRHVSYVKSLKKDSWHPMLLAMVHTLNSSGANNIWEHTILDPGTAKLGKRKPQPKDPVHPNKADFIRAKHQMLSFVYRPDQSSSVNDCSDYSRQLHGSVRTGNLETSLRLLSLGAKPNFFYVEKGCCPLHIAAKSGQAMQVELLLVYGADPGAPDSQGLTPPDYARECGYSDLADRLIEAQYELTDRLTFYLCGRNPEHSSGQHWITPEMADSLDMSDLAKEARSKLTNLPNHLFEELACDAFDEVDRRETDSFWLSLQNQSALVSDRCTVPFLPVNPDYSSTRNQGRQKLARFNAREFASLIIDVLTEARRRTTGLALPLPSSIHNNNLGDVTSAQTNPRPSTHLNNNNNSSLQNLNASFSSKAASINITTNISPPLTKLHSNKISSVKASSSSSLLNTGLPTSVAISSPPSFTALSASMTSNSNVDISKVDTSLDEDGPLYDSVASEDDYSNLELQLKLSAQQTVLAQQKFPTSLDSEDYQEVADVSESLDAASKLVDGVTVSLDEYMEMKHKLESREAIIKKLQRDNEHMQKQLDHLNSKVQELEETSLPCLSSTQTKVHSTSEDIYHFPLHHCDRENASMPPYPFSVRLPSAPNSSMLNGGEPSLMSGKALRGQRPVSMFERRECFSESPPSSGHFSSGNGISPSHAVAHNYEISQVTSLPTQEEVVRKTETITKRIQDLLISAQDCYQDSFLPCAEQINLAVIEMADIFPKNGCPSGIQDAIRQLVQSASRLNSECKNHRASQLHTLDPRFVTQQVIQCAYDIAKAAKTLVTHFQ